MNNFGALFGKLIASPVGNNLENREDDVRRVKGIFSNLGYYKRPVENGIIDQETDTAIHNFQKDNNLKIDGYMNPGGETEVALVDSLVRQAIEGSLKNPQLQSKRRDDKSSDLEIDQEPADDLQEGKPDPNEGARNLCEESAIELENYRLHYDEIAESLGDISSEIETLKAEHEAAQEEYHEKAGEAVLAAGGTLRPTIKGVVVTSVAIMEAKRAKEKMDACYKKWSDANHKFEQQQNFLKSLEVKIESVLRKRKEQGCK